MSPKYWLMKAEPESRIVKGKDVKFSVDDFEQAKTTPWEGVRNAEARNLMKEMKVGDKVLFYHSNCKAPGIAAFAEVLKEAYADYTAWDQSHPYYDQKTDKNDPKWYMVDIAFVSRAKYFVPLAILRKIALAPEGEIPEEVGYIGEDGAKAIKQMALVTRGRLSIQRVEEGAWGVIQQMTEKGGWDEDSLSKPGDKTSALLVKKRRKKAASRKNTKPQDDDEDEDELEGPEAREGKPLVEKPTVDRGRKRKATDLDDNATESSTARRSTRSRK